MDKKGLVTIFSIILIFSMISIVMAYNIDNTDAKIVKKVEPLKKMKTVEKNAPKSVKMNSTHIVISGAKCGCGVNHRYKGKYRYTDKVTFKNWCPYCAKKGWKAWGNLKYNPKRVAEGEITCKRCDADFCPCYNKKTKKGGFEKSGKKKFKLKIW